MRGVFIAGTGTGVGKTVVAAGILRRLVARGIAAVPMKPIQTGCVPGMVAETGGDSEFRSPDLEFCLEAAQITPKPNEIPLMCPYLFEHACSPHLAGRLSGRIPTIEVIVKAAQRLAELNDFLVVEGAGGVMVPINEESLMLDVIRRLDLPVIVVAESGLGTINRTLLTLYALKDRGIGTLGVIYNDTSDTGEPEPDQDEAALIRSDNPVIIEKFSGIRSLGLLPFIGGIGIDISALPAWDTFDAATAGIDKILMEMGGKPS